MYNILMGITEFLAQYVTGFIESTGYITVFIAMVMESMVFPIPSEAVMPFAGFLVAEGKFTFISVILISTFGSIVGSLLSFAIGYYGEKAIIHKYGKFLLLDNEELEATENFFKRYGEITILISRFIPVVRHLISIPAGFAEMNVIKFTIFTIIGAGLWNSFLAYSGFYLKSNWEIMMQYSKIIDIIVLVILLCLFSYYIYRHYKKRKKWAGKS
jgi:membrane protein DedA with SNARE-associated domain